MKHALIFVVALLAAGTAAAQTDPRLAQLEAIYSRLHQEQQAAYQQFQMAQELRRAELREQVLLPNQNYAIGADTTRPLDYDENVRLQRERQERLQRYDRDVADAYARYQELGNRKRALLDQMLELSQPPRR